MGLEIQSEMKRTGLGTPKCKDSLTLRGWGLYMYSQR